jgi:hypothetical protein
LEPGSAGPENTKTRSQGPGFEYRLPLEGLSKKRWRGIVDNFRTLASLTGLPSPLHQQGAGRDEPLYAKRNAGLHITGLISLMAVPAFSYSGSWSFSIGAWAGWLCLALPVGLIVLVNVTISRNKGAAEARSGFKLERDLQQEISISKASHWTSSWAAPRLPASVIASIWTSRFIASSTEKSVETRRYAWMLGMTNWNFNPAAPYIVVAAFLSLRDAGLIRMSVEPRGKVLDSFQRVRVEPTDLALSRSDLPSVEGGLLSASLAFSNKRFGKSTEPAAYSVVREWIHTTQNRPSRWVVEVAIQQGRELGLYEPVVDKRGGIRKLFGGRPKPVYSIQHLAACDDQVVACVARWQEFGANEPELQQRLMTEVAVGIQGRQAD